MKEFRNYKGKKGLQYAYLIDCIDLDNYSEEYTNELDMETDNGKLEAAYRVFISEKGQDINFRRGLKLKTLTSWLEGLCMIRIAYMDDDIVTTIKSWGYKTINERQCVDNWFRCNAANLVYMWSKLGLW